MKNPHRLIGLTGLARSGKDTVADYLVARGAVKHSFAAPLRAFVADILGVTLKELEEIKERPVEWLGGITPRYMMQTVGTEWGRSMIDADLWVKSCLYRAARSAGPVVICDVRFDNEARAIKERGGVIWRLRRHAAGTTSAHVSEAGISEQYIDHTFDNNGTLLNLFMSIEDHMNEVVQ